MITMRRAALVVLLLLAAAMIGPAGSGLAQTSQPAVAQPSVRADFNQDGYGDLAVGAPGEDVGSTADAGVVSVLYGSASGLSGRDTQLFTQVGGFIEHDDQFGAAVASGDFNHDGYADLAVGTPGESLSPGSTGGGGVINVLYGSAAGLTTRGARLFTQVGSAGEPGDRFGEAMVADDFNHDSFADLAVSAPGEDQNSGGVSILYGSAGGLASIGGRFFTQVGGAVEREDFFGRALASGDFNHDGFADLAAGAPFETVGTVDLAGAVSVLYGSAGGLTATGARLFTEAGDIPQAYDRFGEAATSGDFNQDGFGDLAVGAPFERFSSRIDCGAVSVLYGAAGGLTTSGGQLFYQGDFGGPGTPETLDQFGAALTTSG
jgi:FG-GAP repeat